MRRDEGGLPPGYRMEWGGEHESAGEAQASLGKQMPIAFGTMLLITVLLFGKLRQTAVIWAVVPMAVNGVALGLLFTGLPFSFTALLGLLSLSGMLIKNAIVLVEEIDLQKSEGRLPQSQAIVTACVSRPSPVVLAAATTILGMAPLLFDVVFASMAVTIMAGLGFATVLTLIGVPLFYHTYLRAEQGHEVRLIAPHYVKPFIKRQKNDAADAEAIVEAAQRPTMRFVEPKSADQQARAVAFRTREQLVKQRTEAVNALRSHLYEFGHVAPEGIGDVPRLAKVVDDPDTGIPELARDVCRVLVDQIAHLTERIDALKARIAALSNEADLPRKLQTMPGVGPADHAQKANGLSCSRASARLPP